MDEKQQRKPLTAEEKERKSLAALIASDLRKEMARLIGSGLRKASEGAITKFEREMRTQMQVAASYERGVVASMVRGVLDEIGVDRNYAAQIEKHIKLGQFSEAHVLMKTILVPRKLPGAFAAPLVAGRKP